MIDIKQLKTVVRSKKARDELGLVVVEGDRIVLELFDQFLYVLTDDPTLEKGHLVKSSVIRDISSCRTPQHHLGVAKIPKMSEKLGPWVLVLDRLQDPGNVGMLVRAALALGWDGVFMIEPCCDLFNDKALRASRGAIFKLPYRTGTVAEMEKMAEQNGAALVVADLEGEKPIKQVKPVWVVLGTEGEGVQSLAGKKISIPMQEGFESLNVASAGSILLYVLR